MSQRTRSLPLQKNAENYNKKWLKTLDSRGTNIVYYISRSYDGSDDDAIKSTLLNQKYSEYIKKYTDEYSVNVKKRFSYK